jgi:hypothetical protein
MGVYLHVDQGFARVTRVRFDPTLSARGVPSNCLLDRPVASHTQHQREAPSDLKLSSEGENGALVTYFAVSRSGGCEQHKPSPMLSRSSGFLSWPNLPVRSPQRGQTGRSMVPPGRTEGSVWGEGIKLWRHCILSVPLKSKLKYAMARHISISIWRVVQRPAVPSYLG